MVCAGDRHNGRAVLSRWNTGPLLTITRRRSYRKLSSIVRQALPGGTLFLIAFSPCKKTNSLAGGFVLESLN